MSTLATSRFLKNWQREILPWRCLFSTDTTADIVKGPNLLRTSLATRPRPSMLHLPGLRALPFWTQFDDESQSTRVAYGDRTVTAAVSHLESAWEKIWEEYQRVAPSIDSDYQTDTEHHTLHQGSWLWHSYMSKGVVDADRIFVKNFPVTAGILDQLRTENHLFEGTPFGYAFFSTLHGNSTIQPHTAPMNLRLRIHLPLTVPPLAAAAATDRGTTPSDRPVCGIRVGAVTRQWQAGQCLVLDDSYEHEVWNDTADTTRVLLLVDCWHPDIVPHERHEIVRMFESAKAKGWLS